MLLADRGPSRDGIGEFVRGGASGFGEEEVGARLFIFLGLLRLVPPHPHLGGVLWGGGRGAQKSRPPLPLFFFPPFSKGRNDGFLDDPGDDEADFSFAPCAFAWRF